MIYDVIIVGAGPAGASAALTLARNGSYSVLIIDKAVLPREKPCGGAMPVSVESIVELDLSRITANRTTRLQLYRNYGLGILCKTEGNGAPLLVNRREFDTFLLTEARLCSDTITLKTGEVCYIQEEREQINVVLKDGTALRGRYLIGADGALGKTAKLLGLMKRRKFAQSMDAEIKVTKQAYEQYRDTMVMNYFCIPKGYGWIFPKNNGILSCGIGTWGSSINIRKSLDTFLLHSFGDGEIVSTSVKGYPIPVYQGRRQIATDRVMLTGDAAALVDPVSGEGIRYALQSGKIAAETVQRALGQSSRKSIRQIYQDRIDTEVGSYLKQRLSLVSLAFHYQPDLFYQMYTKKLY